MGNGASVESGDDRVGIPEEEWAKNYSRSRRKSRRNSIDPSDCTSCARNYCKDCDRTFRGPGSENVPRRFNWLIHKRIGVFDFDSNTAHNRWLHEHKISHLVSFKQRDEKPLLPYTEIYIAEREPPKTSQIEKFVSIMNKAEADNTAVGFPAGESRGQVACMISCYHVSNGYNVQEAIRKTEKDCHPYRLLTDAQEMAVWRYEKAKNRN